LSGTPQLDFGIYVPGPDRQGAIDVLSEPGANHISWTCAQFDLLPLNEKEFEALRQLSETLEALRRRTLSLERLASGSEFDSFGLARHDEDWQWEVHDQTVEYFSTFYRCLGAFASIVAKTIKFWDSRKAPSLNRTTDLVKLLNGLGIFDRYSWMLNDLKPAREIRVLLDHPQSTQPYNWASTIFEASHRYARLVLYGQMAASSSLPSGATPGGFYNVEAKWHFPTPDPFVTLHALVNAVLHYASALIGKATARAKGWTSQAHETDGDGYGGSVVETGTDTELRIVLKDWWNDSAS
jgi:hypothetical protein